jgi:dTDP-4-amino-4,6-dideoxygalactose transaminase
MEQLAILGGKPVIDNVEIPEELFKWPIYTQEEENALLEVYRENSMSGNLITQAFEKEFAQWIGREYGVACCNGTMSLQAAMFGAGLGAGDEIICPTKTYWASCLSAQTLGATVVFANVDPETLCLDPDDLERCLSPWTKAIMAVHYFAHPCEMDKIMAFAKKHNLKVIEDVSHAQGGYYKGKKLGTFGDVAAMSLMSQKSFAAGELGILVTDDREIYERSLAYLHYERNNEENIHMEELQPYLHMPLSGMKGRANQFCTAIARVQLKYYDERCKEIRKAMNYFWDLLDGVPGLGAIRVNEEEGTTMGGWYCPHGAYYPEQLGGLTVGKFCEAVRAEIGGDTCWAGGNYCLHTHESFHTFDFNHIGKPSRMAYNDRDMVAEDALCNPSLEKYCFSIPWFKHMDKEWIERYAAAYRKVAENYRELLEVDDGKNVTANGSWFGPSNE